MTQPARLTSALLVRKAGARPANGCAVRTLTITAPSPGSASLARFGALHALPGTSEVVEARRPTAARGGGRPPAGPGESRRVAITLRLDRGRHRRLRIFAAGHDRTSQDVILEALDAYLAEHGAGCSCLLQCVADHDDR